MENHKFGETADLETTSQEFWDRQEMYSRAAAIYVPSNNPLQQFCDSQGKDGWIEELFLFKRYLITHMT